jgi:hypothetical protein
MEFAIAMASHPKAFQPHLYQLLPFPFPDYYPADFKPHIPLYKFIELDLKQASAGELLKRITPFDSEDIHEFVLAIEQR